jgi:hypothetical protein
LGRGRNKPGVCSGGQRCEQEGIALIHRKYSHSFLQLYLGVFKYGITGKVIACVAIAEEMEIEPDDQDVLR